MEENREQAQADSACNQERARRRLLQGEEQEERLHDCFGWRLWGMNRIATREWSPSNKTFSPTSFKNRFMKTIARFEAARRERNAPRPAPVIDQVMAVVCCRTFALTEEFLRSFAKNLCTSYRQLSKLQVEPDLRRS